MTGKIVVLAAFSAVAAAAETVLLWDGGTVPKAAELKQPAGIEFSVIKRNEPEKDGYNWLHGVALCWHKGRLWASYGTNRGKENTPTEEAHVRASDDGGMTWEYTGTPSVQFADGLTWAKSFKITEDPAIAEAIWRYHFCFHVPEDAQRGSGALSD